MAVPGPGVALHDDATHREPVAPHEQVEHHGHERDELADAAAGSQSGHQSRVGEIDDAGLEHAEGEAAGDGQPDRREVAEQRATSAGMTNSV